MLSRSNPMVVTDVDFGNQSQTIQFQRLNISRYETQIPRCHDGADLNNNDQWDEGSQKMLLVLTTLSSGNQEDLSPYRY